MSDQLSNPSWSRDAAIEAFDGEGPHAEIIKVLRSLGNRDQYLNVGYSRTGQSHWGGKAQVRLVDRLAKPLRKLSDLDPKLDSNLKSDQNQDLDSDFDPGFSSDFDSDFGSDVSSDFGSDLLDVGCGRGGPAIRLHQKWGMNVTGIDLSDRNIKVARRRTRDLAIHEGLTFKRGDAAHLPFSSESFSFAWAVESMAYVPDKRRAIMEVKRILRPGGVFAMAALLVDEETVTASEQNLCTYLDFLKAWDFYRLAGPDSYRALLTDAGFTVERVEIVTARTLRQHSKRLSRLLRVWNSNILYRLSRRYVYRKTGADLDPIRNQLTASLRAIEAGLLDYGFFWAKIS